MNRRIYLCLAHMGGGEQKFIQEAFDTNWVVPLGPNVNGFEDDIANYVGENKQVVALSSGTAALHLALLACGVGPGDEVLVQSFTFCASVNPIVYLGAKPIFIDSESETWNMDPQLLERAIVDRIEKTGRAPKAIVPVHLYGMPADMERIMKIAERYNIAVVEDAAEAMGSEFRGRACGTFGRYGALSFNGNKMITTSGGGAVLCPDVECKKELMFYATQARENFPYYQHEKIGYNYRMSNICAGIGRGQMEIIDEHVEHHKDCYKLYSRLLDDVDGITLHGNPSDEYDSNFWLNTILLSPDLHIMGEENVDEHCAEGGKRTNRNVEALRVALDKAGIESRPLWKPMHLQPVYKSADSYVNGVSEGLFECGLCLPSGPCVSEEDVRYIVEVIKQQIIR